MFQEILEVLRAIQKDNDEAVIDYSANKKSIAIAIHYLFLTTTFTLRKQLYAQSTEEKRSNVWSSEH